MLEWTGERFIPGVKGDIEIEHLHRYHAAKELVGGLHVLDIACGEGYGSNILAQRAASVVGVDISAEAIAHACSSYPAANLRFEKGSVTEIPIPDSSVDAVISFETLEHVADQESMIREYKRVLAPGGWLCVSCPDKLEYSDLPRFENSFHQRELYLNEFNDLLHRHFKNVVLYGQRVQYGSVLGPLGRDDASFHAYRDDHTGPARSIGMLRPVYLVGIASNETCPDLPSGSFEPQEPPYIGDLRALTGQLAQARAAHEAAQADIESARRENFELQTRLDSLRSKVALLDDERQRVRAELAELTHEKAQWIATRADLSAQLSAMEGDLRVARHTTRQWEDHATETQESIVALQASRSWRVTRPLRWAGEAARRLRRELHPRAMLSRTAHFAYQHTPLSADTKGAARDFLFSRAPALFESTVTYRRWRESRTAEFVSSSTVAVPIEPLRAADGHWEWSDYSALSARIAEEAQSQHATQQPSPFPILDYSDAELDDAMAALSFPPSDRPLVSIIVPAYNNLKYTVECLTSIMRSAPRVEYEIILADDASTDRTASRLSDVPNLTLSTGAENLHFLRNVNRVLPSARGRYVLLLNNDVQVLPGWLDNMVAAALERSGIGAVGPKLVYPSGHLQEAGCSFRPDGTTEMVGLNQHPDLPQFNYPREVDYCSGACLLVHTATLRELGGFDEQFAPAYCEDSDLCLRLRDRGLRVLYEPTAVVVHHLSKTTAEHDPSTKLALISRNLDRFTKKWQHKIDPMIDVRLIAFYLPQFHPIPENDLWWGKGFTEWSNVSKAKPNFVGHDQPRLPAELGYYDLRVAEVIEQQAELARRYGIGGFCFYYYWFDGRRLLEMPIERLLLTSRPDFPFCLCWANENWTRRWDGLDQEILMAQAHSDADDVAVILDLIRYMRHPHYIRINGRPLLLVYRVTQFPNFANTAATWRRVCREHGLGEIYLSLVESFEMAFNKSDPAVYGCDATVEFPPQGMAEPAPPSGAVINPEFNGQVADYRDVAARYCLREQTPYVRFRGLMPGWDNTARRQNISFCIERATPGAFQAWAEFIIDQTRNMRSGDERIVFVNAWNEWAEGAYLEPDRRMGHTFLQAVAAARDAALLKRRSSYGLG